MNIEDPAFDYDKSGLQYSAHRQTDPHIASHVYAALKQADTILNVGAGAGSYEPPGKYIVAVEPSAAMRSQRQNQGKTPAVIATADALPFDDRSFDASMAMLTIHHWPDIRKGLLELRRVTKNRVVIMSYDPHALDVFWNAAYFPEVIAIERRRYPEIDLITGTLGGVSEIKHLTVPLLCVDGFQEAFYGRPEAFLDKEVRRAQSAWNFLPEGMEDKIVKRLAEDLRSGMWDKKYGMLRSQPFFDGALRLIIVDV